MIQGINPHNHSVSDFLISGHVTSSVTWLEIKISETESLVMWPHFSVTWLEIKKSETESLCRSMSGIILWSVKMVSPVISQQLWKFFDFSLWGNFFHKYAPFCQFLCDNQISFCFLQKFAITSWFPMYRVILYLLLIFQVCTTHCFVNFFIIFYLWIFQKVEETEHWHYKSKPAYSWTQCLQISCHSNFFAKKLGTFYWLLNLVLGAIKKLLAKQVYTCEKFTNPKNVLTITHSLTLD